MTQSASVFWGRPLVSFVVQQGMLLQDLDDAGLVRRFDIGPERLGVKLSDGLHHLIVEPEHVTLASLTKKADLNLVLSALQTAWIRLAPPDPVRVDLNFRFISAANGTYDGARRIFGDRLVRWPDSVENVDSAVSFDLHDVDLEADLHLECGIVEPAEAAERLAMGQPPISEGALIAGSIFPLKSLPPAGLFDSQWWRGLAPDQGSGAKGVLDLWSRVKDKAEKVDTSISIELIDRKK